MKNNMHNVNIRVKISFVLIAALFTVYLMNSLCGARPTFAGNEDDEKTNNEKKILADIDRYITECFENSHIPSMSVCIVDKENVLLSKGYGGVKDSDTPYLIGSVSKSFTAVCIMQLAEQGKIDLNARLSTYLPQASDGDRITVSQLLKHTSGLGEHQNLSNYKISERQEIHNYANVNYSILGEIIEKVSGQSYSDYITEHIFLPLGLLNTSVQGETQGDKELIDGFTNYWGFNIKRNHMFPTSKNAWITPSAGYLSSSANDLARYLQFYMNGGEGILSGQSINRMFYEDTVFVDGDVPYSYGYGWATVKEPLPEKVYRHSGLVETGTACVFILPERDIAIAITANVNDYFVTNEIMDSLGWGVVLMLLGEIPNEIGMSDYILSHILIDMIMFAVLLLPAVSLYMLPKFIKKIKNGKIKSSSVMLSILFNLLTAIIILLIVPLLFDTPLWVAKAFVPDVYITVVLSSLLSILGFLIKIAAFCCVKAGNNKCRIMENRET